VVDDQLVLVAEEVAQGNGCVAGPVEGVELLDADDGQAAALLVDDVVGARELLFLVQEFLPSLEPLVASDDLLRDCKPVLAVQGGGVVLPW
jgi:hypothetical protein